MIILGISCFYHDAAACILHNGKLVAAAAEERFTRIKHDNGFPKNAINYCLEWLNIKPSDITAVAFYEKPIIKFERVFFQHLEYFPKSFDTFKDYIPQWFGTKFNIPQLLNKQIGYKGKVYFYPHHISHAASAFYFSGFNKSTIITLDGVGEWSTTAIGEGIDNQIMLEKHIRFPHSLGLLYSTLTSYLGFHVNDAEYKVMGLAAYGNPKPYHKHINELVHQFPDGSFKLNMKYFEFGWNQRMYSDQLQKLFKLPPRPPESVMIPEYENIAASLQEKLEDIVVNIFKQSYKIYKNTNVCFSGGVALNSVLNGKILSRTPYKKLYIPPDPSDAGGAIGAALLTHANITKDKPDKTFTPYLGPSYPEENIKDALSIYKLKYSQISDRQKLLDTVAKLLMQQKIIGWFQGRMEWGPRALGNRSILAAATKPEMKDIINSKVKHRELFRPFAPAILEEFVQQYFKGDKILSESAKYMLLVYPFTQKGENDVPATVHVDNTGRLQVVSKSDNPLYYDLIKTYYKKIKIPVIINTSFNVRGEPIVCTPNDAIKCYLRTDIDHLVIGNYLVSKR